jgi:peptide/nickel transport system permease protein
LPEMSMGGLFMALAVLLGLVGLFAWLLTLARMFRTAGRLWGLLGIIPIVSFAWGWINVRRQKITGTMVVWTLAMVAAILLVLAAPSFQERTMAVISVPGGVAIWGVVGSLALGALLGLNAGYRGGWWDQSIMQVLDALIAFPRIVLYLVVIAALGQGDLVVVLAITVTGAPGVARLARGLAMDIKTRDYIRAAETRGENVWWIMFRETLPNASGPLLVDAMLRVGYAIFAIGTLGFLGIGLPPPDPDWGNMVNEARRNIFANPLAVIWPALAIATLVIGLNLFADGLNEEMTRYQK